jgi:hypothetical protein
MDKQPQAKQAIHGQPGHSLVVVSGPSGRGQGHTGHMARLSGMSQ